MNDAKYSPEDNKIRIYPDGRIDEQLTEEEYKQFKAAGYKWAAKQECFVCPRWTPEAEDWALELCGEIGDEDYSPEERSADRAERFTGYREKRRGEAHDHADNYEAGPAVFGHQSRARAERQARRHDRQRHHALNQWSKAEYWQQRTAGVIAHALYRSSAPVRRSRLLRLESEQRKQQKSIDQAKERYAAWLELSTMPGGDQVLTENANEWNAAQRKAYMLAGDGRCWWHVYHPTNEAANAKAREIWKHGFSAYDLLTKTEFVGEPMDKLTPHQVAALYLEKNEEPAQPGSWCDRWAQHYELRISYEKAMLEAEGGMVAEADIEPGGWIRGVRTHCALTNAPGGWVQVHAVTKSPATKRVVSVKVMGTSSGYTRESAYKEYATVPALVTCKVSRLGEDCYRPPTDEERAAFQSEQAAKKAARKATAPKSIPLLNPTDDDAERLQALWNLRAEAKRNKEQPRYDRPFEPSEVLRITQAKYSELSKGTYARLETRTLYDDAEINRRFTNLWSAEGQAYDEERKKHAKVCTLRTATASGSSYFSPQRVVILTDKPQKPLPIDWEKLLPADEEESGPKVQKSLFTEGAA